MAKKMGSLIFTTLVFLLWSLSAADKSFGQGEVSFQPAQNFAVGIGPRSVAVGDFNQDSILDLATANFNSDDVSILLGNGDGTFEEAQNFRVGSYPASIAVGDFNGDKIPDLAVSNRSSFDVSVLVGNGDGTFQDARNFVVGVGPLSVAVDDFNGDKRPDLVVANFGSNTVSVLLNDTPVQPTNRLVKSSRIRYGMEFKRK